MKQISKVGNSKQDNSVVFLPLGKFMLKTIPLQCTEFLLNWSVCLIHLYLEYNPLTAHLVLSFKMITLKDNKKDIQRLIKKNQQK